MAPMLWWNLRLRPSICFLFSALLLLGFLSLLARICINISIGFPLFSRYILIRTPDTLPPLYSEFNQYELQLPQHIGGLEGQKLIWISNHVRGQGWGNVMQELLLNHYLAYRAGRSFVFTNSTWDDSGSRYSYWKGIAVPSQIPLSALIKGPTVGAQVLSNPHAPLAVRKEYWDRVCPHPKIIQNADIAASFDREPTAGMLLEKWLDVLTSVDDNCVEIPRHSASIFDIFIMGSRDRLLDIWPSFSTSPIMREFGWSPLVELAFDENREIISPSTNVEPPLTAIPFTSNAENYTPIPGLLVLHVRRGDFKEHCNHLSKYSSTYVGYNGFPSISDTFSIPSNTPEQERRLLYQPHCFPDIEQIVRKVKEVYSSSAGQGLRNVYIMTNGREGWVNDLKLALARAHPWETISSSRDLFLNSEQKYVKQAVDMLVGQRAQVIIGNGFSSLTGQIVMLRMANGLPPNSNVFW